MRFILGMLKTLFKFVRKKTTKTLSFVGLRVFYIGGYWRGEKDIIAQMLRGLRWQGQLFLNSIQMKIGML